MFWVLDQHQINKFESLLKLSDRTGQVNVNIYRKEMISVKILWNMCTG